VSICRIIVGKDRLYRLGPTIMQVRFCLTQIKKRGRVKPLEELVPTFFPRANVVTDEITACLPLSAVRI
jgi:hypothetical protein